MHYKASHLFIYDESKVALNSSLHFVTCLLFPRAAWCGGKHTPTALKCVSAKVSPGAAAAASFFFSLSLVFMDAVAGKQLHGKVGMKYLTL